MNMFLLWLSCSFVFENAIPRVAKANRKNEYYVCFGKLDFS